MNKPPKRLIAIAAAASALPFIALGALAAPALASPAARPLATPGPLINSGTGDCLTAVVQGVYLTGCEPGQRPQQWVLAGPTVDSVFGCLTAVGGRYVSVQPCGQAYQAWGPYPGSGALIMNQATGQCLAEDEGTAIMAPCDPADPAQNWTGATWGS